MGLAQQLAASLHTAFMEELVLRKIVLQFDGRVVEVFGAPVGEVVRHHVALVHAPEIGVPDRRGRSKIVIGRAEFGVDPDELELLRPFLGKIGEAVRSARP
jgi:hypothetical protein